MPDTASLDGVREVSLAPTEYFAPGRKQEGGSVDIYGAHLDSYLDSVEGFEAVLSAAERREITRLKPSLRRRRVTISRGGLRMILGSCLEASPNDVPLCRDSRGKPQLDVDTLRGRGRDRLQVSCSRSGAFAIFAVATGRSIGIDIEATTGERFADRVAEFLLSPSELVAYGAVPNDARTMWLARAWVCKEAILKGLGCGLEIDPASMTVGVREWDVTLQVPAWAPPRATSFPSWWLNETMWNRNVIAVATQDVPRSLRFVEVRFPSFQGAESRARTHRGKNPACGRFVVIHN